MELPLRVICLFGGVAIAAGACDPGPARSPPRSCSCSGAVADCIWVLESEALILEENTPCAESVAADLAAYGPTAALELSEALTSRSSTGMSRDVIRKILLAQGRGSLEVLVEGASDERAINGLSLFLADSPFRPQAEEGLRRTSARHAERWIFNWVGLGRKIQYDTRSSHEYHLAWWVLRPRLPEAEARLLQVSREPKAGPFDTRHVALTLLAVDPQPGYESALLSTLSALSKGRGRNETSYLGLSALALSRIRPVEERTRAALAELARTGSDAQARQIGATALASLDYPNRLHEEIAALLQGHRPARRELANLLYTWPNGQLARVEEGKPAGQR